MVKFTDITWDNFWEVINLKPDESQVNFLPSNSVFMAQAYINLKFNYPDICYALSDDQNIIGFCKIVFVPKNISPFNFNEDAYLIDALMIDQKYQGKGYGEKALDLIISFIKTNPWGKSSYIKLLCYKENKIARQLYEKNGFDNTGEIIDGKILYSKTY